MELKGKTALVTGSSRGIGRTIAIRLAAEGADVVVNYAIRAKAAAEVAEMIEEMGSRCLTIQADISNEEEVRRMVAQAEEDLGPVGVLVNNASVHKSGKIDRLRSTDWDAVIKCALYGAFYCCKYTVPGMKVANWGRIINISSTVGERGYPGDTAYCAAKAGIIGFTKSLAKEVGRHGITVNAVMPGFVLTEMTQALTPENIETITRSIPLERVCEASDVAELVCFLAAHGSYSTGSVHHVDGGLGM